MRKIVIVILILFTLNLNSQNSKRNDDFARLYATIGFGLGFDSDDYFSKDIITSALRFRSGYRSVLSLEFNAHGPLLDANIAGFSMPLVYTHIVSSQFKNGVRSGTIEGLALSGGLGYNFRSKLYGFSGDDVSNNIFGVTRVSYIVMGLQFYVGFDFDITKATESSGDAVDNNYYYFGMEFPLFRILK